MQTERAYYHVPVSPTGTAEIREIRLIKDTAAVILDKTIFYPEGGGQSSDRGTINGAALVDVQEKDGEILHILSAAAGDRLRLGTAELALDVLRRRDLTIHHTGQHLLSGIILSLTGKSTVSMHIGEAICTIDVDTPSFSQDALIAVEEATADAIEENQPVIIHLCPPEKTEDFPLRKVPPQGEAVIRVVEIQGRDFSPCCGTHLQSTGQIGMLRILGAEKYKAMTRVYFIAGRRVLRDSRLLRQNGELISQALKVPIGEIGKGTLALLEKTGVLGRSLKAREEETAQHKAQALFHEGQAPAWDGALLVRSIPEAAIDEAIRIGRAAQKMTRAVILLSAPRDSKFAAFCSEKDVDLRSLIKEPLEACGGRGGGSSSFFQGVFPSQEALRAFMDAFSKITGLKGIR
ncbi:MAG: alanyl-tRNA editing protein [Treponema sp.]|jgi:alanyl-tRNA synthetase|nr:alanyl-tRNA editing protein [Treponema sp.]